jgi:hypothetical protein
MRTALAVLVLLAAVLGAAVGTIHTDPLPLDRVDAARRALRRARIEAAELAGEELARADAASRALERQLAEERAARWRRPRSAEVERLALETESAALAALRAADLRERHGRKAVAARREELAGRVDDLTGEVAALVDRDLRADLQRARIEVEVAGEAEGRGDLAAAAAALDLADRDLTRVEERLDNPSGTTSRLRDPELLRLWQDWVDETIKASRASGSAAVVVDKLARRCALIQQGRVVDLYAAELGRNGLADKLYEGDNATPEGRYRVTVKRDRGSTRFYRALMLDYPTEEDRREHALARRHGRVPRGRGVGGLIEIHGHGGQGFDWTNGCVALRNRDMDLLFAAVEVGTPVTIVGSAHLPGDPP